MADTLQTVEAIKAKSLRERLSCWDSKQDPKAPLTDRQKDAFIELTTLSSNRRLPIEVSISSGLNLPGFTWIHP